MIFYNSSIINFERGILTVQYDPKKVNDDLIVKELSKQTTYKITKIQNNWIHIQNNSIRIEMTLEEFTHFASCVIDSGNKLIEYKKL